MTGPASTRLRPAVRALIVDEADRVLLVRFDFGVRTVWATPGGGIETGETAVQALRRELIEEVGLHDAPIGPALWVREHRFEMGSWAGQSEVCHLVRTASFEPVPAIGWERMRQEYVHDIRWWSLTEIEASGELFAPRALAELVATVFEQGPPDVPLVVGV